MHWTTCSWSIWYILSTYIYIHLLCTQLSTGLLLSDVLNTTAKISFHNHRGWEDGTRRIFYTRERKKTKTIKFMSSTDDKTACKCKCVCVSKTWKQLKNCGFLLSLPKQGGKRSSLADLPTTKQRNWTLFLLMPFFLSNPCPALGSL